MFAFIDDLMVFFLYNLKLNEQQMWKVLRFGELFGSRSVSHIPYTGCLGLGIIPWSFSNLDFSSELLAVDVSGILMACAQLPLTHIRAHGDAVR